MDIFRDLVHRHDTIEVKNWLDKNLSHFNIDEMFMIAVDEGHIDAVKFLLDCGADIHTDQNLALRWSTYKGYIDMTEFLLDHGADIHSQEEYALCSCVGLKTINEFFSILCRYNIISSNIIGRFQWYDVEFVQLISCFQASIQNFEYTPSLFVII